MTFSHWNLLAVLAMSITCIIGVIRCKPEIRFDNLTGFRGQISNHFSSYQSSQHSCETYPMRYCIQGNYYRFLITQHGNTYRAYLESMPRFNRPMEELGVKNENGRYFIDAGKRASAAACEEAARSWANARTLDLMPVQQ